VSETKKALNSLREQRRNAQRGMDKARMSRNRIAEQRFKREVKGLDDEIKNLESE
jgi:hypothetical protein